MKELLCLIIYVSPLVLLLMVYCRCKDIPLFKMCCRECGKRDRNWSTVPTGFDDFGWQHNCEENKDD